MKEITVRVWEETEDGDASFEAVFELNPDHAVDAGPMFCGNIEVGGKEVWLTIN